MTRKLSQKEQMAYSTIARLEAERDQLQRDLTARDDRLAERDALLKRQPSFIRALEQFEADDGTFVRLTDVLGALSASAEPSAPEITDVSDLGTDAKCPMCCDMGTIIVDDTKAEYELAPCPMCAEPSAPASFQQRVHPWLMECFGQMIAGDREERNHRFLEEALELVQSLGATAVEAHQLVDYVYGRPVGDVPQEVGGVMVTLAALCLANDLDMHNLAEAELARVWTKVEQIRAKQANKPQFGPLPGVYPDRESSAPVERAECAICRDLGGQCMECEEAEFREWAGRHFANADYRKTASGVFAQDWMRHAYAAWCARAALARKA